MKIQLKKGVPCMFMDLKLGDRFILIEDPSPILMMTNSDSAPCHSIVINEHTDSYLEGTYYGLYDESTVIPVTFPQIEFEIV